MVERSLSNNHVSPLVLVLLSEATEKINNRLHIYYIFTTYINLLYIYYICVGFSGGSVVKDLPASAGDAGLIPGSGRLPGEGNGNPLQYSCLGNPMERGAWWVTVHRVSKESDAT